MLLRAAEAHYRLQQRVATIGVLAARRTWDRIDATDLDASWRALGPRLVATVAAAQTLAAQDADTYLAAVLAEQQLRSPVEGRVDPHAFSGVAGDGRDLDTLLYEPIITTKTLIGAGAPPAAALTSAGLQMSLMAATAVQDAGRAAVSAGTTARPRIDGYVRMLNPPSCQRCAVLAGKWFRWSQGFQRHPRCDCRHIPSSEDRAGDLRTDPLLAIRSGNVTGLSRADTKAILEDGADVGQVINAHRGMSVAQVYGQRLKITSEGITRRGIAGKRIIERSGSRPGRSKYRQARDVRPMPESLYDIATDRADAIRLLKLYGYIL